MGEHGDNSDFLPKLQGGKQVTFAKNREKTVAKPASFLYNANLRGNFALREAAFAMQRKKVYLPQLEK